MRSFTSRVVRAPGLGLLSLPPPTDIIVTFVSRQRQHNRKISNEAQLAAKVSEAFMARGELIEFGDFSCAEQLAQIRKSRVLVGPHGAGLTHLVWLPQDSAVIEVHPRLSVGQQAIMYVYRNLAKWAGVNYLMLRNTHANKEDDQGNFEMDEGEFVGALDAALRIARNAGRGVTSCGFDCGNPPKPRLWTPVSFELDTKAWINVHDAYEKQFNWPHGMPDK
mmetsp:Transcript_6192/g.15282  ORF Transcript_6192/g.15282 Transcript_6192/m.15282 type:complete len:221 (-) Transcript_6192:78-740(-)